MRESVVAIKYVAEVPSEASILTFDFSEGRNGIWIGECLELGTVTEASALKDVRDKLSGAVGLQLNQMEELGFGDGFLQEHNVHRLSILPSRKTGRPPQSWALPTEPAIA